LFGFSIVSASHPPTAGAQEPEATPAPRIELLRTERGKGTIKLLARLVENGGGIGSNVIWRVNGKEFQAMIAPGIVAVGDYLLVERTFSVDPSKVNELEIVAYDGSGLRASPPYRLRVEPWAGNDPGGRRPALLFHGSLSGEPTFDLGDGGGNPFASALIAVLAKPSVKLSELPAAMRYLTARKSGDRQAADVTGEVVEPTWALVPRSSGERRVALVLIVSSYTGMGPRASLSGAKHDAGRVAAALAGAGFVTEVALDLDLAGMRRRLAAFADRSRQHDAALIYTTGHGVEIDGKAFLLPGDYPIRERSSSLEERAMPLTEITGSARAKRVNLVFYGGCRDNPWPGDARQ
jgi:hypothetical protein